MKFTIEPHYCIPCLDGGHWVVTTAEVPITVYTSWPMCMAHVILHEIGKVICV